MRRFRQLCHSVVFRQPHRGLGGSGGRHGADDHPLDQRGHGLGRPLRHRDQPDGWPTAGGTSVTINGANLSSASAVNFGATPGIITAESATAITATSPAESAGTVDVTVTTPGGASATSSADKFTYVPRRP